MSIVATVTSEELIGWYRQHMAAYKVPNRIVFEEIVKTSTGKVQKFVLRRRAAKLAE